MVSQKCLSCRVQFESAADHRTHFQSEWHCYNLKRKIATLPPLTEVGFYDDFSTAENSISKKPSIFIKIKTDPLAKFQGGGHFWIFSHFQTLFWNFRKFAENLKKNVTKPEISRNDLKVWLTPGDR